MQLFILGAGKPAHGFKHVALTYISEAIQVLDWKIHSFESIVGLKDIYFLGGYHVDEVIKYYPELNFTVIPNWEEKTVLHTLFKAPFNGSEVIVSYADTIFRNDVINQLKSVNSDVIFFIDSFWQKRYATRTLEDINKAETLIVNEILVEFTGLIYFSKKIAKRLSTLDEINVGENLIDLIHFLLKEDLLVKFYDVKGQWAEFNSPDDLAKFILGTKAETLARLEPLVKKSHIGNQVSFNFLEWKLDNEVLLDKIQNTFLDKNLIIRSSSKAEDNWNTSNAGEYKSILNVDIEDRVAIKQAIEEVLASYGSGQQEEDQILVQSFLENVSLSGVIFTCGLESGSPYYRINFDDISHSTESVTAGMHDDLRTIIISRFDSSFLRKVEPDLVPVLDAIKELEQLLGYEKLDIEFAVDNMGKVHIFQVRPISVSHVAYEADIELIAKKLSNAKDYFQSQQIELPFIYSQNTILSNMSDWNPAEIIGIRPKPLAFSLYRELITNDIWAQQRFEFGYSDVRSQPLILSLAGQPYVDVRASFNSFIPQHLSKVLKLKLVNAYLEILAKNPQLHDKIEFNIVFTVWTPGFLNEAYIRLTQYGIDQFEIVQLECQLKEITKNAFLRLDNDIKSIYVLESRREKILTSNLSAINKAFDLLADCKKFGTLAFAHAARAGFIGTAFLNSLVDVGIFTNERKQEFLTSFQTVSGIFQLDKYLYSIGECSLETVVNKYGHLRPGTYELTSKAYWEDPIYYFQTENLSAPNLLNDFMLSSLEIEEIDNILIDLSPSIKANQLMQYIKESIQAREFVKFEFTKNLSFALNFIIEFGSNVGISRDELAFLEYSDIEKIKLNIDLLDDVQECIHKRYRQYTLTHSLELPSLIKEISDFYCFERFSSQPNFITIKKIESFIQEFDATKQENLLGKIVLIEQADPGYDWLFGLKISGLVTKYGGANSHMAIRAAEIGLPAAIGVGEKFYEEILNMRRIEMDCLNNIIREIK